MRAGPMRWRVRLQRKTVTFDALGGEVETWTDLVGTGGVAAAKHDVSDGERNRASETASVADKRFTIRWSDRVAALDPMDRLVFEGRTYNILGVKDALSAAGAREGLEISCRARAETPA